MSGTVLYRASLFVDSLRCCSVKRRAAPLRETMLEERTQSAGSPTIRVPSEDSKHLRVNCFPEHVSEILVLAGTAGAGRMAPPGSARIYTIG